MQKKSDSQLPLYKSQLLSTMQSKANPHNENMTNSQYIYAKNFKKKLLIE